MPRACISAFELYRPTAISTGAYPLASVETFSSNECTLLLGFDVRGVVGGCDRMPAEVISVCEL